VNHAVVTEHLADYLEGDLALDQRALVDAHLDSCEECKQEVREMQQTIRLLRALPEPEVPPMIAANVMRRIRAGETRLGFFERIQRALGGVLEPSFVLPASAVAVAALVVVAIQDGSVVRPLFVDVEGDQGGARVADASEAALPIETLPSDVVPGDREFGASAVRELAAAPARAARAQAAPTTMRAAEDRFGSGMDDGSDRSADEAGRGGEPLVARQESAPGSPWGAPSMMRDQAASDGGGRGYFGDPSLAQGFASPVSGPATSVPSRSIPSSARGAMPLALAPREGSVGIGFGRGDSGGEDPRDVWLARALEEPAEFARYIARHNLAEQELWVERLAERALARGLMAELVETLRAAGDEKAAWLADDFAAQASAADSSAIDGDRAPGPDAQH